MGRAFDERRDDKDALKLDKDVCHSVYLLKTLNCAFERANLMVCEVPIDKAVL